MLVDVISYLVCPHCGAGLSTTGFADVDSLDADFSQSEKSADTIASAVEHKQAEIHKHSEKLTVSTSSSSISSQSGSKAARHDKSPIVNISSLRCANGHVFDIAHQGYVTLGTGKKLAHPGDNSDMIIARENFLKAGHFSELRTVIANVATSVLGDDEKNATNNRQLTESTEQQTKPTNKLQTDYAQQGKTLIVDAGAGTGYYLAGVLDTLQSKAKSTTTIPATKYASISSCKENASAVGLALDSSRFALRRAAFAHPRMGAVGCDIWGRLPVADACADLILNIFAPRNGEEFARILAPNGCLITVTPTSRHQQELVMPLDLISVDPHKEERLAKELLPHFTILRSTIYEQQLELNSADVTTLVAMGPSSRHSKSRELHKQVARMGEKIAVTISVKVTVRAVRPVTETCDNGGRFDLSRIHLMNYWRR